MKFILIESGHKKSVTLKKKTGDFRNDFFHDVEAVVKCTYIPRYDAYLINTKQFELMVEYWKNQVNHHNDGMYTELFGSYDENQLEFEVKDIV